MRGDALCHSLLWETCPSRPCHIPPHTPRPLPEPSFIALHAPHALIRHPPHHSLSQPLSHLFRLGRRVVPLIFLCCIAATSALPDAENGNAGYEETRPAELQEIPAEPSGSDLRPHRPTGTLVWLGRASQGSTHQRRRLGESDPLGTCDGGCTNFAAGAKGPGSLAGAYSKEGNYLGSVNARCPHGCRCQHKSGESAHCHARKKEEHCLTEKHYSWCGPAKSPSPPSPSPSPPACELQLPEQSKCGDQNANANMCSDYFYPKDGKYQQCKWWNKECVGNGFVCDRKQQGTASCSCQSACPNEVNKGQCYNQGANSHTCSNYYYRDSPGVYKQCRWGHFNQDWSCRGKGAECVPQAQGQQSCRCPPPPPPSPSPPPPSPPPPTPPPPSPPLPSPPPLLTAKARGQGTCACADPTPCAHDAPGNDSCLSTTGCAANPKPRTRTRTRT